MEVLILPIAIGIVWVAGAIALFVWMVRRGSLDHSDRLALLPLKDDAKDGEAVTTSTPEAGTECVRRPR